MQTCSDEDLMKGYKGYQGDRYKGYQRLALCVNHQDGISYMKVF